MTRVGASTTELEAEVARLRAELADHERRANAQTEQLERLGIPFEWATNATAAARECETHRFEAALVDAGLSNLPQVMRAIDLRGRRQERSVVVFSTGEPVAGLAKLDPEPVPFDAAAREILAALEHGGDEYA